VNFSEFQAATHISKVNCAEITGDKPRQLDVGHAKAERLSASKGFAPMTPVTATTGQSLQTSRKDHAHDRHTYIYIQVSGR